MPPAERQRAFFLDSVSSLLDAHGFLPSENLNFNFLWTTFGHLSPFCLKKVCLSHAFWKKNKKKVGMMLKTIVSLQCQKNKTSSEDNKKRDQSLNNNSINNL